jgi:hypothetical protein
MPAQIATTTGTFAQPIITAFRSGGSSVIFGMQPYINILTGTQAFPGASTPYPQGALGLGSGNMNLDSQLGINTGTNGYQELNSFLQWWCANSGGAPGYAAVQTGRDAAIQVMAMLADIIRNPEMRRIYAP